MADAPETIIRVNADTKAAEESFDALGERLNSIGKKASAALAGYFSFKTLVAGFEKAVESAMEAEKAVRQFNSALIATGTYTEAAAAGFENYADALERTTGVSAELILNNAALLVSIGKLQGEGLKRATQAALDLARGMQIDVGSAFDIVTKASQGNVMALTRYGLQVSKAQSDTERFGSALDFIESRFGGLSKGSINTFEGALAKVRNGFNDVFESAGKLLTKDPKFIAGLSVLGDLFYRLSASISASNINLGKFMDLAFQIGKFLTDYLIRPLELIARILVNNMLMLPRIMLEVYTSLAGGFDKILGTDLQSKIEPLKNAIASIQEFATAPLIGDEQLITTRLSKGIDDTKIKIDELAAKIKNEMPNAVSQGAIASESAWEQFSAGFTEGLKGIAGDLKSLGKAVSNTFVNGFTNAFAAMGKALVSGGDAFGEFGRQALSTLGAVAIQIGQMLILAGLGFSVIPGFQKSFGAVIAGAALIVLGGVLQGLGAGGGTPAAAGAGAGTVGAGGTTGPNPMTEPTPEDQRAAAQTGVQVIVQGNIFDSRETGLQIAQIINDSFDLNGTIIRANA